MIARLAAAALTLGSALALPSAPVHATDRDLSADQQLAAARSATAEYRSLPLAADDGYQPHMCLARAQGGMGFHYFNESLFGSLDPEKPAGLLYEDSGDGGRQLVGVEWVVPVSQAHGRRPRLFGQDFQGPMPGHYPGMPTHYDLHVWLYKDNPRGMFSPWNPDVKCPAGSSMQGMSGHTQAPSGHGKGTSGQRQAASGH